jgi:formylglycine-generating enzyme required for sulfatase activity
VYDAGEEQGHPFLVVDYLDGGDLSDRLRRAGDRMTAEQVLEWLPTVAGALDAVHQRGIVHRDVKPGNILFDEDGHAFLSDFGIAAQMQGGSEDTTWDDEGRITVVGGFVGSPAYAPPEAVQRELSPAYDQYSLGVVVYRALAGKLPFDATTAEEYLIAKARDVPTPLDPAAVGAPDGCAAVVMRALSRRPADRYPSCRAFAEAFAEAARGGAVSGPRRPSEEETWVVGSRGAEPSSAPRPGRRWVRPAGAALVLAASLATAWLILSPPDLDWRSLAPAASDEAVPAAAVPWCFEAGSTPEEVDAALALCERSGQSPCKREWYASETLRDVCIDPVDLDRHEVTVAEFAEFVAATGHETAAERAGYSWVGPFKVGGLDWRRPDGERDALAEGARHPVVHVSAADAAAYCRYRGERLPTRDEWEYLARGPERRAFPWGDRWDPERAAWGSDRDASTRPVGSFATGAGPRGHLDLAGNVWEWTSSRGPDGRSVLKGGSYREANPANLRTAAELRGAGDDTSSDWGFRCARDRG